MLEKRIGYWFQDRSLLRQALTHKSYLLKNQKQENNERLEFLGDAILGFTIAHYLYEHYGSLPEGELTKVRSLVVCEQALYQAACRIDLGSAIYLGKGEEQSDGRNRPSILSDALEALFAAIYIDGGAEEAQRVILSLLSDKIEEAVRERDVKDYKTLLQELVQRDAAFSPLYHLIKEEGPDHNKVFTVSVSLEGKMLGTGTGKTKKEAEKRAAREALSRIGQKDNPLNV